MAAVVIALSVAARGGADRGGGQRVAVLFGTYESGRSGGFAGDQRGGCPVDELACRGCLQHEIDCGGGDLVEGHFVTVTYQDCLSRHPCLSEIHVNTSCFERR